MLSFTALTKALMYRTSLKHRSMSCTLFALMALLGHTRPVDTASWSSQRQNAFQIIEGLRCCSLSALAPRVRPQRYWPGHYYLKHTLVQDQEIDSASKLHCKFVMNPVAEWCVELSAPSALQGTEPSTSAQLSKLPSDQQQAWTELGSTGCHSEDHSHRSNAMRQRNVEQQQPFLQRQQPITVDEWIVEAADCMLDNLLAQELPVLTLKAASHSAASLLDSQPQHSNACGSIAGSQTLLIGSQGAPASQASVQRCAQRSLTVNISNGKVTDRRSAVR